MPPILTGDHPLPGNSDINALVRKIVKCAVVDGIGSWSQVARA
jgi:hypothetical protein